MSSNCCHSLSCKQALETAKHTSSIIFEPKGCMKVHTFLKEECSGALSKIVMVEGMWNTCTMCK